MKKPSLAAAYNTTKAKEILPVETTEATSINKDTKTGKQENRKGKQSINAYIEPLGVRELKLLAINEGKTQKELFIEAINDLLVKYGMKPLA